MSKTKTILLWVMGLGYVLAGLNHFLNPANGYTRELPTPPSAPGDGEAS